MKQLKDEHILTPKEPMIRILITGENSFIGRAFIESYNSLYHIDEICLIKNKLSTIGFENYDVVIHVAALVHSSKKISRDEYLKINADLPFETAMEAKNKGVKQFVFLSSVKVYGENTVEGQEWNETSECNPIDNYGYSKLQAERKLNSLSNPDFLVTIIRSSVVYGPGVKANILSLIKLVDKFYLLPFLNINNKRSFIYINNLVYIIEQTIVQEKKGIFIATDGFNVSTSDLVKLIAKNIGKKKKLTGLPFKQLFKIFFPGVFNKLFGNIAINNSHTLQVLNLSMPISFNNGIKMTVDWYLNKKISR